MNIFINPFGVFIPQVHFILILNIHNNKYIAVVANRSVVYFYNFGYRRMDIYLQMKRTSYISQFAIEQQ